MALFVKKFGGSSVASPEKMRHIAERVLKDKKPEDRVVIVVSAMGDSTDDLLHLARQVSPRHYGREMDMLLTTGEQVSVALMAMTFIEMGVPAVSMTGARRASVYQAASGRDASGRFIRKDFHALEEGKLVMSPVPREETEEGDLITLAAAAAIRRQWRWPEPEGRYVRNLSDVDGIYSADPRCVPDAVKMKDITYMEMLEMARLGAGVMQPRSVEMGSRYQIPIHVRSTFTDDEGTVIREKILTEGSKYMITGVAQDADTARWLCWELKISRCGPYAFFRAGGKPYCSGHDCPERQRNS